MKFFKTLSGYFLVFVFITISIIILFGATNFYLVKKAEYFHKIEESSLKLVVNYERILRGINEAIITEGTPDSLKVSFNAIKNFNTELNSLSVTTRLDHDILVLVNEMQADWSGNKASFSKILNATGIGPLSNKLLVTYGKIMRPDNQFSALLDVLFNRVNIEVDKLKSFTNKLQGICILLSIAWLTFMFYFFHSRFIHPIEKLNRAINKTKLDSKGAIISKGNVISELKPFSKEKEYNYGSDINSLLLSFEDMLLRLQEAMIQRVSDRRKLEKNEKRFRMILNSTGEGMIGVNPDGICTFSNPAAKTILAMAETDEIIGTSIHEILIRANNSTQDSNEDDESFWNIPGLISGKIVQKGKDAFLKTDGSIFHAGYAANSIEGDSEIEGVIISFTDITSRVEALLHNKKLIRAIEQSPISVVLTNTDAKIEYVNKFFTELTGYSAQEAIGSNPKLLSAGISTKGLYDQMWKTISGGNTWRGVFINKKKNGEIYKEDASISPVMDRNGKIISYVATKKDITDRLNIEEELNDLKIQIEYILGATKTGLDVIDGDYNIRYVDPIWAKKYGSYENKKCYYYFQGRNKPCETCSISKVIEHKIKMVTENTLPKENNRPIQVTSLPFKNSQGEWLVAEVNADISYRKEVEAELAGREAQLEIIMDSIRMGVLLMEPGTYKIRMVNQYLSAMLGRTKEELIGKNCHGLLCFDAQNLCPVTDKKQTIIARETFLLRSDNTRIPIQKTVKETNINGKDYLVESLYDISDLKKTEKALEEALLELNLIFDSATSGMRVIDRDHNVMRINETMARWIGKEKKQIIGTKCSDSFKTPFCNGSTCFLEISSDNDEIQSKEINLTTDAGEELSVVISVTPLIDSTGKLIGVIEYFADVTSVKNSERKATEALMELNYVLNTSGNAMRIIDLDRNMLRINKTMCDWIGIPEDNLMRLKCDQALCSKYCETEECFLEQVKKGASRMNLETKNILPSGKEIYCAVTFTPYYDSNGKLAGVVEDYVDITERKMLEKELKKTSITDELTKLLNRRGFIMMAKRALSRIMRSNDHLILIYADLDGLKTINDVMGHDFGDRAIHAAGQVLREAFRKDDIIGRLGGDEFAVLATCDPEASSQERMLEKIEQSLSKFNSSNNRNQFFLSLSFGGVQFNPDKHKTIDMLIAEADVEMYNIKRDKRAKMKGNIRSIVLPDFA